MSGWDIFFLIAIILIFAGLRGTNNRISGLENRVLELDEKLPDNDDPLGYNED